MIGPKAPKQPKKIPVKNRRIVDQRSGGVCESCGDRPSTDIHHRKYLSRGGTHDVHNLIALCGGFAGLSGGNHSGCHGRAHRGGEPEGLSIWSHDRSETKPVLYRGVWVLPDDDGGLKRLTEAVAEMLMRGGFPDD